MSIPGTFLHAREALAILAEDEALGITPDFLAALDDEGEEVKKEIERLEGVLPDLKIKLNQIWEGETEYEYELVSVFMHRGGSHSVQGGMPLTRRENEWSRSLLDVPSASSRSL
jgi:ubiquitin carboxyl-terminal hydrolase 25/28